MNTRERVLKEALNCVNGEREKQYGNPEDNFSRIADLWSVYLTSLFEDEKIVVDIDPIDVAKMMILFKIARSNGDQDKLDNYIDILGYGACAAEIFENENKERVFIDEWVGIMEKLGGNAGGKEFSEKTFRPGLTPNPDLHNVEVANECKECDYAKKCIKDKPDEKCSRKDCGLFDACMTAYQHYIYNKTKEASEAIDKCMCENCESILDNFADHVNARVRKMNEEKSRKGLLDSKDPYSYAHDKLANYVAIKAKEEHIPLDNLKSIDRKFPRELEEFLDQAATDCVENGKQFLDCYKEIDALFEKYKNKKTYNSFWEAYTNVSDYITSTSKKANLNPVDVVNRLIKNEHAPTAMANLLMAGKLGFDDIAADIEDAINEVKKEV